MRMGFDEWGAPEVREVTHRDERGGAIKPRGLANEAFHAMSRQAAEAASSLFSERPNGVDLFRREASAEAATLARNVPTTRPPRRRPPRDELVKVRRDADSLAKAVEVLTERGYSRSSAYTWLRKAGLS